MEEAEAEVAIAMLELERQEEVQEVEVGVKLRVGEEEVGVTSTNHDIEKSTVVEVDYTVKEEEPPQVLEDAHLLETAFLPLQIA